MEEVDGIIIHSLRSIGCDIEDGVTSLQQFTTDMIVEGTARCLRIITGNDDVSYKLPPSMSAKFRIGTSLATALQEAGYKGEVGYQTFLYSNEADIRKVFIFLVEKLPKESAQTSDEPLGASAMLQSSISAEIAKRLKSPWTPSYCKKRGVCWRGTPPKWQREGCQGVHHFESVALSYPDTYHDLTKKLDKDCSEYNDKVLKYVTSQVTSYSQVAPSLIHQNSANFTAELEWESEWNTLGLASRLSPQEYKARKREKIEKKIATEISQGVKRAKSSAQNNVLTSEQIANKIQTKASRFANIEKLQYSKEEEKPVTKLPVPKENTEEEQLKKREEELTKLKSGLGEVTSELEKLQLEIKKFNSRKEQIEERADELEKENQEKKEAFKVKKKTMDLLPDADNNIAKLKALVAASEERLVSLEKQWDQHRIPLEQQYNELKSLSETHLTETQQRLEDIKRLQERMKEAAADARSKEELHKQLTAEYQRMTKDVNRSAYTKRIMEIVANIKRQKEDIEKILIDTKVIQKEINQLAGKLGRTFTVTDELIFQDAKKDEAVRRAYKYLAALHESFELIISTVEETGSIMRETRDLEEQVEQESNSKVKGNLQTITKDLEEMRSENAQLMQQYKKQQKTS